MLDTDAAPLLGASAEESLVRQTASRLLTGVRARNDVHATGEDRLTIASELVARALAEAARASQANHEGVQRVT